MNNTTTAASLVPVDVPGWTDFVDVYEFAVEEAPPGGHLVEVGSWHGKSAILMARLIQHSGKRLHFTCVDHFRGSEEHHRLMPQACVDLRARFVANLERYAIADAVRILPLASVEAAATFADDSLDFVFLDASHDETSVRQDIAAWLPKVKPGAVLAGHDWDFPGVCRAVKAMLPARLIQVSGRTWIYRRPGKSEVVV